jgi:phospholipid/cholesterol/gamma-HCH transport system ATP-binding protein
MEPYALEFRDVSHSFDDKPVLTDVSFQLEPGQMIVITGASGSGKSVLVHLAIGLLRPDRGQVLIEGQDIAALEENELLELRSTKMGIVFQEDTLFTGMNVYDNAAYRLDEHGWSYEDTDRAVGEILRFVGLAEDVDKFVEELSIGMRRRLEIARGLVGWPRIMLFDEPTSGLDPINARQVLDLIIRARDIHGISSLLVTKELHQIPHVVRHHALEGDRGEVTIEKGERIKGPPTRVMVLVGGKIGFIGSLAEFQSSSLPDITFLTHPETGLHIIDTQASDPWKRDSS